MSRCSSMQVHLCLENKIMSTQLLVSNNFKLFFHAVCSRHQGKYKCIFRSLLTSLEWSPHVLSVSCYAGFHHREALLGGLRGRHNSMGSGRGSSLSQQEGRDHTMSRRWLLGYLSEEGQWVPGMFRAGRAAACLSEAADRWGFLIMRMRQCPSMMLRPSRAFIPLHTSNTLRPCSRFLTQTQMTRTTTKHHSSSSRSEMGI